MLLDVGEDHPREPEQLVEALARLLVEQRPVLLGEPVALALDLLGRPLDLLAVGDRPHVPDERRVRDARVVEPAPVVVVEPVARRHVEPRVLHLLELLEPCLPGVALRQLVVDLLWRAPLDERRAHAGVDGETREPLELGIRHEEQHVDAGDHLGDVLVGDVREDALAEVGERRVGSVSEEEELAVVLPREVAAAQQAPVRVEHLDVPRVAIVLEHDLVRLVLAELRDANRSELGDQRLHLLLPLRVQLVPVLEVVARALLEELRALGDLGGIGDRVAGDVDVAVDHR